MPNHHQAASTAHARSDANVMLASGSILPGYSPPAAVS